MQSGVWNPFVWLFSLTGRYTLYSLQLETLLYVFLSGCGMYCLLKHFKVSPVVNLFCSTAYMLCGFNTDSGQFLNWISSSAFIPFTILFYYKTLIEQKFKDIAFFGIFLYLMFVTAYPAHFILLCYLLLALFIWVCFGVIKQKKDRALLWHLSKVSITGLLIFVLLSLPAIISFAYYLPLSERGGGATFPDAMSNPLHPLLLFSYFAPLAVFNAPYIDITDGLERDSYFGIIAFIFFLTCLIRKKEEKWVNFCKWAFLISLLFSFGEWGGIRVLSYYALPLMNTFRHPAGAKVFSIFFAVILSAHAFDGIITGRNGYKKDTITAFKLTIAALLILCAWAISGIGTIMKTIEVISKAGSSPEETIGSSLKSFLNQLGFHEILLFNITMQLIFVLLFYFYGLKKNNWAGVVKTGIINSILMASLLMPFTVVKKDSAEHIQNILTRYTINDFPLPALNASINYNSGDGMAYFKEIGTLNMYNKKIGRVEYRISPSNLLTQNLFWKDTQVRNTISRYPFLYRADSAIWIKSNSGDSKRSSLKKYVFVETQSLADSINNTLQEKGSPEIRIVKFDPCYFNFHITAETPSFFCISQNNFPFWKIKIDGRPLKQENVNISFMGFGLSTGTHTVEFIYKPAIIITAIAISLISLFVLISLLAYYSRKESLSAGITPLTTNHQNPVS
jgi:hypothetical protein